MASALNKKTPVRPVFVDDNLFTREVLRGQELMSPRPAPSHALCATVLSSMLSIFQQPRRGPSGPTRPGGWVLMIEPELHLGDGEVIVPDIAGWRIARMPFIPNTAAIRLPPDWACEVLSPSTERTDRTLKFEVYAAAGVPYLWLVQPIKQTLEVYVLHNARYQKVAEHAGNTVVTPEPFAALPLDLAEIWPQLEPA
jgi:Uma2 family endonuclease